MAEFITAGFNELLAFTRTIDPAYIYLVLFAVAFVENIIPPIPGDTMTIVGGYLAAAGQVHVVPLLLAVTLGTIGSVMVIYILGYKELHDWLERKNLRLFSKEDLSRVEGWFRRHGAGTLLVSRFVMGARVVIALGAGISKYPPRLMFIYSLISAILFHGVLVILAYLTHAYIERLAEGFDIYSKFVLAVVAVAVILWFIFLYRRMRREQKSA